MNDPNKRIDVNLSSLLSLKAELLRKHEEVSKAKSSHLIRDFVPRRQKPTVPSDAKQTAAAARAATRAAENAEDAERLERSKRVLEQKSKYYDRMCRSGGTLNSEQTGLVMFNQKKQTIGDYVSSSSSSSSDDDADDKDNKRYDDDDEDDWVEYTDCLGRTRKCLRKDVEFFKRKDEDLAEIVADRMQQQQQSATGVANNSIPSTTTTTQKEAEFAEPAVPPWIVDTKGDGGDLTAILNGDDGSDDDDALSMISKASKIDEMRLNWERQERENMDKEFVHYQDVLYDEARNHGVGFYKFSTDDSERSKQHQDLEDIRLKTLEAQRVRDEQRKRREDAVRIRVRAAQNRQRARQGLPPLEDEPAAAETTATVSVDEKQAKRLAKEAKRQRKREQAELKRADARTKHIRPWDKGKDGVARQTSKTASDDSDSSSSGDEEWSYQPEREPMSQEQWNEKKRAERNQEFAPTKSPPPPPQQSMYRAPAAPAAPTFVPAQMPRNKRPFVVRHVGGAADDGDDDGERPPERRGAEIAPPTSDDYYGGAAKRPSAVRPEHLENSIAAGLKFLREQSDKGTSSTKMKWTSNADY